MCEQKVLKKSRTNYPCGLLGKSMTLKCKNSSSAKLKRDFKLKRRHEQVESACCFLFYFILFCLPWFRSFWCKMIFNEISCTGVGVCLFVFPVSGGLSQILSQDKQPPIKQRAMATNPIKNVFVAVSFPQTELKPDRCQSFSITLLNAASLHPQPPAAALYQFGLFLHLYSWGKSLYCFFVCFFLMCCRSKMWTAHYLYLLKANRILPSHPFTKHSNCYPAQVAGF